jgi:spoIIIJ-associated protein
MQLTAKNLDELLDLAAQELDCSRDDIAYNILEDKKGILGLGASVTAEVWKKEEAEAPAVQEEIQVEERIEEAAQTVPEEKEEPETEQEPAARQPLDRGEVKEFLFDYLGNFFVGIDLDMEVAIEDRSGTFIVNLNADNNAVLIGRGGKTLDALNTVVRSAVNAQFHSHIDVLIDVNHYKEDRYRRLASMARRTAKQVQRSHVDAELDPMPNDERKAVHRALNGWHNIRTESRDQGEDRHVCILYVPDEQETEDSQIQEIMENEEDL